MTEEIREKLIGLSEEKYRDFSKGLIPDCKPLLGVRLPMLRSLAKELTNSGAWKALVASEPEEDLYFEEVMLRGMLIGSGTSKEKDIEEALRLFDSFVPLVDNWSVCDSCCLSLGIFEKHKQRVWEHIQPLLYSEREFEVRVALIVLLAHFLKFDQKDHKIKRRRLVTMEDVYNEEEETGEYTERILNCLDREFVQGYYAQMAAAWLTAECFVTFPYRTGVFLKNSGMDTFTYNKALSKICESRIPAEDVKQMIKMQKRAGEGRTP